MRNRSRKQGNALRRLWQYIRRYRILVILSVLLAAASVALTLVTPILLGRAIDHMVGPDAPSPTEQIAPLAMVLRYLIAAAMVIGVTALLQWILGLINNRLVYRLAQAMRQDAFRHLQRLPLRYIDRHPIGEIVSRLTTDVDQVTDGLLLALTQLFPGVVTLLGTLLFMLSIHPLITLVVVVLTPLSLLIASFIARRSHTFFEEQANTRGQQTAFIDEMINNQRVVQAFGREDENCRRFDEINERLERCSLKAIFFSSLVNPTTRVINSLIYAGVGLAGALAAISGGLTVGGLSCFLNYAGQYAKPFNEISGVVVELQNALACAGRFFELLDQPAETPDPQGTLPAPVEGRVELAHVSFAYDPTRPLLQEVNLSVQAGRRIAIVGPTGCGKTTLINLLMRFYDVDGGAILVDGHDIREVSRHSLRGAYGMVLQDTWLKSGTVRENLLFGRPDATEEEMIAAAKAAHAHGFITRLPQGYDTLLSANGGGLSLGQRQLLCIARVMLCRPPMLILDEATSSIDALTERRVQTALEKLMEGRTSFIVAHRLSTIRQADLILVMKDGNIIEQGRHDDLLAQDGFYTHLYNSQFAGQAE